MASQSSETLNLQYGPKTVPKLVIYGGSSVSLLSAIHVVNSSSVSVTMTGSHGNRYTGSHGNRGSFQNTISLHVIDNRTQPAVSEELV